MLRAWYQRHEPWRILKKCFTLAFACKRAILNVHSVDPTTHLPSMIDPLFVYGVCVPPTFRLKKLCILLKLEVTERIPHQKLPCGSGLEKNKTWQESVICFANYSPAFS